MFKSLILTTDFSDNARGAYGAAVSIAREHGSTVHLVHEAEPIPPLYYEHVSKNFPVEMFYERLEKKLQQEAKLPVFADVEVETSLLRSGGRYETIPEFAEGEEHDLIVTATHGRRGLSHLVLGSFAEKLVRHSPVPVLTYRAREGEPVEFSVRRVLVPFDFSDNACALFPYARYLGDRYGARFTFVDVFPEHDEFTYGRFGRAGYAELFQEASDSAIADAKERFEEIRHRELADLEVGFKVRRGVPAQQIACEAQESEADLVLMGTHGWTGMKHFFLGSVAEKVLRSAPCSVLTVRPVVIRAGAEDHPSVSDSAIFVG